MPSCCYRLRFSAGTVLVCLDLLQCALRLYGSCHVVLHVYAAAADQLWPPLRILGLWNRARGLPGHVGNARVLGNLWNKSALFRRLRCSMCSGRSRTINKKTRLSGADAVKHTAPPCTYGARTMRSKALPKRMVHPHKADGRYGQTSVRLHMV